MQDKANINLVIFGITSNLAQKYLIPALYDLEEFNLLPHDLKILGIARSPKTNEQLKEFIKTTLNLDNRHHQHEIKEDIFQRLCAKIKYIDGHLDNPKFYLKLNDFLQTGPAFNTIFYLATFPNLYQTIFQNLNESKLSNEINGWVRLMVEKPIGSDLESAKEINQLLSRYFKEEQIYRLDHYLGKDTMQNILTFRFGNNVFEHLINKEYLDHIQVTALEDFGIGQRGEYYDQVGALKDVGQNHLLQMLAFAAMDKPLEFSNQEITKKRAEVLSQLRPLPGEVVFGQYKGYLQEESVSPDSMTDTFFAFKTFIDNDRFNGIPVYFRGGKKLNQTVTEVSLIFKLPKDTPFTDIKTGLQPNVLIYRIQPNEGIVLEIMTKKSGMTQELEKTYMQYCYREYSKTHIDPYQKLIIDCINGDRTFFSGSKEVEEEWKFIDPLASIRNKPSVYEPGSYGPKEADELIESDGRQWLEPSNLFCKI